MSVCVRVRVLVRMCVTSGILGLYHQVVRRVKLGQDESLWTGPKRSRVWVRAIKERSSSSSSSVKEGEN